LGGNLGSKLKNSFFLFLNLSEEPLVTRAFSPLRLSLPFRDLLLPSLKLIDILLRCEKMA